MASYRSGGVTAMSTTSDGVCPHCNIQFKGKRGLSRHWLHFPPHNPANCKSTHGPAPAENSTPLHADEDSNGNGSGSPPGDDLSLEAGDHFCSLLADDEEDNVSQAPNDSSGTADGDSSLNFTLLKKRDEFVQSGAAAQRPDNQHCSEVELLQILKDSNAPLYLYDSIMEWAHTTTARKQFDFSDKPRSRETVLNEMYKELDLNSLKPKAVDFLLPDSRQKVKIVTHDFRAAVYSLLTDPDLMQDDNLLFEGDDPFAEPPDPGSTNIDDINTGSCFWKGYQLYCKIPNQDVMCPIILFFDCTHTDA